MDTETYELANEVLENEVRRRKQIPIAVFTVISLHVALFVALLSASGCKGGADGKLTSTQTPEATAPKFDNTSVPPMVQPAPAPAPQYSEPVHPAIEPQVATSAATGTRSAGRSTAANTVNGASGKVHVVKAGDNLNKIARSYGTTAKALKQVNNLKGDTIRVGQKLRVG